MISPYLVIGYEFHEFNEWMPLQNEWRVMIAVCQTWYTFHIHCKVVKECNKNQSTLVKQHQNGPWLYGLNEANFAVKATEKLKDLWEQKREVFTDSLRYSVCCHGTGRIQFSKESPYNQNVIKLHVRIKSSFSCVSVIILYSPTFHDILSRLFRLYSSSRQSTFFVALSKLHT